jgi:hypothetical protein
MKNWEIIADNLSEAGWSWGWVSPIDSNGRTIWIADAHRGDRKRFVVRAEEKPSAFLELELGICTAERPQDCGAREISSTDCRDDGNSLLNYVIRRFNLSSALLNKPQGLDFR